MSFMLILSGAPTSMLTFAQRRRISLLSVAVLPDMLLPSRLARRASRYVKERGNIPQ
jgi:ABC-type transport system involved in cytochrome c biogenesis permease component